MAEENKDAGKSGDGCIHPVGKATGWGGFFTDLTIVAAVQREAFDGTVGLWNAMDACSHLVGYLFRPAFTERIYEQVLKLSAFRKGAS